MIRPTDNLRSDHVVIGRGLAVLSAIASHLRLGLAFPVADCAVALRFLREFVLGVHLHKESSIVLPRIAMYGSEGTVQAVGDALRIHEQVAELTHSLVMFWEPTDLSAAECAGFAETVDAVASRCRRLEHVEETMLLPAFDADVPPDDQLDCDRECAAVEASRSSRQIWVQRLAPLVSRWLS
jgi:hemerythrin-like domain-containing protein